ncbi:MAG TPA: hypothetical protein V6C57_06610 [Coleofasciculaceae cyanobacterium]
MNILSIRIDKAENAENVFLCREEKSSIGAWGKTPKEALQNWFTKNEDFLDDMVLLGDYMEFRQKRGAQPCKQKPCPECNAGMRVAWCDSSRGVGWYDVCDLCHYCDEESFAPGLEKEEDG